MISLLYFQIDNKFLVKQVINKHDITRNINNFLFYSIKDLKNLLLL